jgi:hypothetical protein
VRMFQITPSTQNHLRPKTTQSRILHAQIPGGYQKSCLTGRLGVAFTRGQPESGLEFPRSGRQGRESWRVKVPLPLIARVGLRTIVKMLEHPPNPKMMTCWLGRKDALRWERPAWRANPGAGTLANDCSPVNNARTEVVVREFAKRRPS